ncbi:MAG: HAD family hydrolase [Gaiellaceae bacterium]|jgi:putative hydrolase of the HAD superfamily
MTPRAVIFDLWGTLVPFDTESWQRARALIAEVLGVPPEEFEREWSRGYDQRVVSDLRANFESICLALGVTRADAVEDGFRLRVETYREMFEPSEDAVTTLRELRARGYQTGLITNCTSEDPRLLDESSLAGLFDVKVFSCQTGLRKPDRAIYELAATQLGVDPQLCLYIGDGADHELDGARSFGMSPVLLRPGDTQPPEDWKGQEIARLAQVLTLVP